MFDPEAPIWSESVLLACTSPDGRWGVFGRLCRYPSAGVAWVWLHAFLGDEVIGYVADDVPCGSNPLDTEAVDLVYAPADPDTITLAREGSRESPRAATMHAHVPAHAGNDTPSGPGPIPLLVEARFEPEFAAGGTLRGRTELLGTVEAEVSVAGETHLVQGRGQWHEQHQEAPRFRAAFRYASLRGERIALIALGGPWGSRAFVRRTDGPDARRASASFDGVRAITVTPEDGEPIEVHSEVAHAYTIALYGRRWRGHQVTARAGADAMSGFVNEWEP